MVTPGNTNETADSPEGGEEVDWKTRAETLQQENERLAKEALDARAEQNGRLRQGARDETLVDVHNKVGGLDQRILGIERGLEFILDAVGGDPDTARQRYNQLQRETTQTIAESNWNTYYQAKSQEMVELNQDDQGQVIVPFDTDPAMDAIREAWFNAKNAQDRAGIERAISQAKDVVFSRRLSGTQNGSQSTEGQSGENKGEGSSSGEELFSMDTGPTSGGSSGYRSPVEAAKANLAGRLSNADYQRIKRENNW